VTVARVAGVTVAVTSMMAVVTGMVSSMASMALMTIALLMAVAL
jgi:hypothetical protein